MVELDYVSYSNTVEIILTQPEQLHTVESFSIMTILLQYTTKADIWTKVQPHALHNMSGSQVVL